MNMSSKVRAAIVTPVLSHFELPLFRLAANLPDLATCVFHTDPSDGAREDGVYKTTIHWGENLRDGYPSEAFPNMQALRPALWAWQPDIILQYGYSWKGALRLLFDARSRRVPITHRGLLTTKRDPRARLRGTLWRRLRPVLLRQFQAHHFGGSYSQAVLDNAHIPKSQQYFVPFSVDTQFFSEQTESEASKRAAQTILDRANWRDKGGVVLFICNHGWVKGPDIMIKAFSIVQRRLQNTKLLVVGSGEMTEFMKSEASRTLIDNSYAFAGFIPSKETVPYYLAADISAFPSRYDTWARAVNESMIARRPCIVSSNVAAAGGLVQHGINGYVIDDLTPSAFAETMIAYLLLEKSRRETMGLAARERAHLFSYEANQEAFLNSLIRPRIQTARR